MPDSFSINGKNKSPNNFKESQEILHMQLFIEIFVCVASLFPQGKGSMRKRRQKDCYQPLVVNDVEEIVFLRHNRADMLVK